MLRRSASRGASSPLARSSLPRISRRGNGDISRIFQGHFTGISGIFRLSSTWHSPPPYTLALLAGDEHYSSLLAVWNFEHYGIMLHISLMLVLYSSTWHYFYGTIVPRWAIAIPDSYKHRTRLFISIFLSCAGILRSGLALAS